MDLKFCSLWVWILTVFITVHAKLSVNCPNITTHTKEDPLILKCSVICEDVCMLRGYQWKTNRNKILAKNTTSEHMENYTEFNYTIQNQSDKQSGTYNFWIQTDNGAIATPFTVAIGFGINCPNIANHPEEAPLTLKCNVTCEDSCTLRGYSWINVGENKTLYKNNTSYLIENYKEFNYTFQNQSDKQIGTYTFWILTDIGTLTTNFTLTKELKPEETKEEKRKYLSSGVISFMVIFIILFIVIAAYKKSVRFSSVVHECLGWSAPPNSTHSDHVVYKDTVRDDCECEIFI